ncbi:hypothetical protein ISCGN_024156 [Ixodes scapularis]
MGHIEELQAPTMVTAISKETLSSQQKSTSPPPLDIDPELRRGQLVDPLAEYSDCFAKSSKVRQTPMAKHRIITDDDALPVHQSPYRVSLKERKATYNRTRFLVTLLVVFRMDIFWVFVVTSAYYGCLIARIPILESLISDSSSLQTDTLAVLFLATCVGDSLLSCYQLHLCMRLAQRIRSILQAAMFQKMTRLSPTSRAQYPAGRVVSILGVDCMMVSFGAMQFPMPIIGIICSPIIFVMLSARVGMVPAILCAAWLLLIVLLPIPISRIQKALWSKLMQARDERLKRMADLLSSVRLVKMYAWEDAYMGAVTEVREKEMAPVLRVNLLDGVIDSLYSASTSVMTIILFGALTAMNPARVLNPALSFSCIYMLSLTDMVTNSASLTLRMRSLMSLSMRRILKFSIAEEQETQPTHSMHRTQRKGTIR